METEVAAKATKETVHGHQDGRHQDGRQLARRGHFLQREFAQDVAKLTIVLRIAGSSMLLADFSKRRDT